MPPKGKKQEPGTSGGGSGSSQMKKPNSKVDINEDSNQLEEDISFEFNDNERKKSMNSVAMAIKNGKDIDIQQGFKAIIMTLFNYNLAALNSKVSTLEEKVETIEENVEDFICDIESLQNQAKSLEVEAYQCKYVLKNVPMIVDNDETKDVKDAKETPESTMEVMTDILKLAGLKRNAIDETFRLYPKKNAKNAMKSNQEDNEDSPPTLFVKFTTKGCANLFYQKLSDVRKSPGYENLQVDRMIPPCLMADYKKAQDLAYNLRKKENKNTRVELVKNDIVLKVKNKSETKYVPMPFKK